MGARRGEMDGFAMPVKGLRQSLCATCRWKHDGQSTCLAFGDGIPTEILLGHFDHREPYPGDLGIQYEPRDPSGAPPGPLIPGP